jgi:hypothetical protein
MEGLMKLYQIVMANSKDLIDAIAYLVLTASVIIKLTPTLKDDNYFKPIVKFIGKYIALDKYGPKGE